MANNGMCVCLFRQVLHLGCYDAKTPKKKKTQSTTHTQDTHTHTDNKENKDKKEKQLQWRCVCDASEYLQYALRSALFLKRYLTKPDGVTLKELTKGGKCLFIFN